MAEGKPQFDKLLGGTEELPFEVSIMKLASARAQEILALTEAIEDPQKTALVFQRLPKLMRRRVMSHNAKRMPRRLREAHLRQLERSGLPPKPKRPSRRYRRRPKNLLQEYNRRQKEFVWLETHIWHAKRFHMVKKWGYKLANYPNDKSFRACYRASTSHCLLQDLSFYSCVELRGPVQLLLERLAVLTDARCGLTFAAKAFIGGHREGTVTIFHPGMYPFGAIGNVHFLWKSGEENVENLRTLWIWVHPANYILILNALITVFGFSQLNAQSDNCDKMDIVNENILQMNIEGPKSYISSPVKKKAKLEQTQNKDISVEQAKLATRNDFERAPKYENNSGKIQMVLLKDTLNRFRLTGPLSLTILLDALHVFCSEDSEMKNKESKHTSCTANSGDIEEIFSSLSQVDVSSSTVAEDREVITLNSPSEEEMEVIGDSPVCSQPWWAKLYGDEPSHRISWQLQQDTWASLRGLASPAQLPPYTVLALTVLDPRIQMPTKRTKVLPDPNVVGEQKMQVHPGLSHSPIWDATLREQATLSKLSTAELARKRSENLIPGFMEEELPALTAASARIPLLLLQRPGSQDPSHKRLGFGCGWDMIAPVGWGMPLWLALVFRGARVGGLRESAALEFEGGGGLSNGVFAPDTVAGREESDICRQQLMEKHFRLPPNKRPNFIKLGIVSPFSCCWDLLIKDWCKEELMLHSGVAQIPFYVLRDREKLGALKSVFNSSQAFMCRGKWKPDLYQCQTSNSPDISSFFSNVNQKCLVPVTITILKKGRVSDFAIICIPSEDDIANLHRDSNFQGPMEPLNDDKRYEERKEARIQHQRLLKRLRKKRVRNKQKLEECESESERCEQLKGKRNRATTLPTQDLVEEQAARMRRLWLPECESVKDSCSRIVLGFVCKGDFSFTEACGGGTGYVALPGLFCLVGQRPPRTMVLVRNPSSLQYRFAVLQIH